MAEYIEREALNGVLCKARERECGTPLAMIDWFQSVVSQIPAAAVQPIVEGASHDGEQDVAPVVHGEWVPYHEADIGWDEYGVRCSKCNWEFTNEEFYRMPHNYCPNCGAKMDEQSCAAVIEASD